MIRSHNIDWNHMVKTAETASFNISKYEAGDIVVLDPAGASAHITITLDAKYDMNKKSGPVHFLISSATTTYQVIIADNSLCYSFAADLTLGSATKDLTGKLFTLVSDSTKWAYEGPEDVDFEGDLSVDSLTSAGDVTVGGDVLLADGQAIEGQGSIQITTKAVAAETDGSDIDINLVAGGVAGVGAGGEGGDHATTAGAGGAANAAAAGGTGGDLNYTAGTGGAGDDDVGALGVPGVGGTLITKAGAGGAGTAATQGGADGGDNALVAGAGGVGGAATVGGVGGDAIVRPGAGGATGGGGAGADGEVKIGDADTSAIEIGNATDNPTFEFLGSSDVVIAGNLSPATGKGVEGDGNLLITTVDAAADTVGFTATYESGEGGVAVAGAGGAGGALATTAGAGGAGVSGFIGGAGGALSVSAGVGGIDADTNAGAGGALAIAGGAGGSAAVADVAAGDGGALSIAAGAGGAGGAAGAVGGSGGDTTVNAGAAGVTGGAGAGSNGNLLIGAANTSELRFGNATDNPGSEFLGTGGVTINGPLITLANTLTLAVAPTDDTAEGVKIMGVGGEAGILFGMPLYKEATATKWKIADAVQGTALYPCIGIALGSAGDGDALQILLMGTIADASRFAALTTEGAPVYLNDTVGTFSETAPSDAGDAVQRVGIVIGAATMYFNPSLNVGIV